jgi:putative PIN family toxin of toxin-antitoxin system
MGTEERTLTVVLDTNVLLSALLFKGTTARIVDLWKERRIICLLSRETFQEFSTALRYPKFALTEEEIKAIIEEEVLPYFEVVKAGEKTQGVCSDPDDDKFLSCALGGKAEFIVTGDRRFLILGSFRSVRIVKVSVFLTLFRKSFETKADL